MLPGLSYVSQYVFYCIFRMLLAMDRLLALRLTRLKLSVPNRKLTTKIAFEGVDLHRCHMRP